MDEREAPGSCCYVVVYAQNRNFEKNILPVSNMMVEEVYSCEVCSFTNI